MKIFFVEEHTNYDFKSVKIVFATKHEKLVNDFIKDINAMKDESFIEYKKKEIELSTYNGKKYESGDIYREKMKENEEERRKMEEEKRKMMESIIGFTQENVYIVIKRNGSKEPTYKWKCRWKVGPSCEGYKIACVKLQDYQSFHNEYLTKCDYVAFGEEQNARTYMQKITELDKKIVTLETQVNELNNKKKEIIEELKPKNKSVYEVEDYESDYKDTCFPYE